MESTVIKIKGLLQDSRVMMGGVSFLNPTRANIDGYALRVVSRFPNVGDDNVYVTLRAFDGELGSTSSLWTPIKTEVISGSVVKTYRVSVNDNNEPFTYEDGTKVYSDRQVRLKGDPLPWRVDVLGDDVDPYMGGLGSNNNPLILDAEQFKYSTLAKSGITLGIAHTNGAIKTEWLKGNTNLRRLVIKDANADIQGSIMDLVACPNIEYLDVTTRKGITGVMTKYLAAMSAAGVKNHLIEFHVTSSGIVQDAYWRPDETDPTKRVYPGVFEVWFDENGVAHPQKRGTHAGGQ